MKYIIKDNTSSKIFNNEMEFKKFLEDIDEAFPYLNIYYKVKINSKGNIEYEADTNFLDDIEIKSDKEFLSIKKQIEDFAKRKIIPYSDVLDYLS